MSLPWRGSGLARILWPGFSGQDSLERKSKDLQNQGMKSWFNNLILPLGGLVLGLVILGAEPLREIMKSRSLASSSPPTGAPSEKAEVKLQLEPQDLSRVLDSLSAEKEDAKLRRIFFFDTPDLSLFSEGVILRARIHEQGKKSGEGDTTVKIRDPRAVNHSDLDREGFKCEWDIAASAKRACSYTQDRGALDFARVLIKQDHSVKTLLTSKQRDFLQDHLSSKTAWESLKILGPIYSRAWKLESPLLHSQDRSDPEWSIELWELPGVARFLELSTRSELGDADTTLADLRDWCQNHGIRLTQNPSTKTEWVLKYFSKQK